MDTVEIVLRPRGGKPNVGDLVIRRPSGGVGHVDLQQLKEALGDIGVGGILSVPPEGGRQVVNIFVNAANKLEVVYEDVI